jgi:hypothetical protein
MRITSEKSPLVTPRCQGIIVLCHPRRDKKDNKREEFEYISKMKSN